MPPTSLSLKRIKLKLQRLRAGDKKRQVFRARDHRYQQGPPLSEAAISSVENSLGVELPTDYRHYLTDIANGGAGPYFGIHALQRALEISVSPSSLSDPFPFEEDVVFSEDRARRRELIRAERDFNNDSLSLGDFLASQTSNPLNKYHYGALRISDFGCGDYFCLILTGRASGTIWAYCLERAEGIFNLNVSFLEWYENWLNHALQQVAENDFRPAKARYSNLEYGRNSRYQRVTEP